VTERGVVSLCISVFEVDVWNGLRDELKQSRSMNEVKKLYRKISVADI